MKFGKELRGHLEDTLPGWRDKFLCYKPLKKLLKNLPSTVDSLSSYSNRDDDHDQNNTAPHNNPCGPPYLLNLQDWFVRILNEELEKFNDFYIDKEEEFIIRFQELKERIEQIREKMEKDAEFTSDTEFNEELMEIRKDFVTIHGKMVLLKNYSSLNFAGLVKILKKYDKRTGGLLQLPFTQLALHQPFSTTEPLTRLVHECEANLELLFPSEAEVVESSLASHGLLKQPIIDTSEEDMPLETPTTFGEETRDIYRSTLAAMRTIKGLQKASSTYNPLSISYFYSMKDEESASGVTDENSNSNSPSMPQNKKDANRKDEDG